MAVFLSPCCLANSRSCHDRLAWWVPHVPNNLSMFWSQACLQLIQLIIHQNHPIAPKHPPSDRINQLNQLINHFIQPTFTNSRISFWTDDQLRFRWQDWARAGGRARRTRRSDAGGLCGRSAVVEKVNCGKIWENRRKKSGSQSGDGKEMERIRMGFWGGVEEYAAKVSVYSVYRPKNGCWLRCSRIIRILRPELQEAYRLAMISWQLDAFLSPQVESQNMSEQS